MVCGVVLELSAYHAHGFPMNCLHDYPRTGPTLGLDAEEPLGINW